ncbi:MAG: hypothetical protein GWM87_07275 [Xanthomonadales bacterium]|nr:hypothetical protein [Xanthomonadales bacterium]NIX12755.1 hypothetical protein [Xanthomonadales bacterium]
MLIVENAPRMTRVKFTRINALGRHAWCPESSPQLVSLMVGSPGISIRPQMLEKFLTEDIQ